MWEIARANADRLRDACVERFGPGETTFITDAAQQVKCGRSCRTGNPNNALYCQCQRGGVNHGGVSGWTMYGELAIDTEVVRRIFKV